MSGLRKRLARVEIPQVGTDWQSELILNTVKAPTAVLANAIMAFRRAPEWSGVFGFDTFTNKTVCIGPPPWDVGSNAWRDRPWSDRDDVLATNWLQHHKIAVGVETTQRAIEAVAMDHQFHPIIDYLDGLQWDGRKRLNQLAHRYLGAERSEYVATVGRCALIGAIARVRQPGCKLDTVPIIEGPQGIRKSSAVRTLGGPWFTDEISDFGSKDAAMQAATAWFIEIGELDAMSKAETSRIKAFISRTTDRYRPPFGRRVIESKRPSVFWGTTNSDAYLKDETGARRFWPIRAGRIDIDALANDRDQLFAEADALYRSGEPWWMTGAAIEIEARIEQKARFTEDAWQGSVEHYLQDRDEVAVNEVLMRVFDLSLVQIDQRSQNRVVACLKQLDFERFKKRVPTSPTGFEWRYRRKDGA